MLFETGIYPEWRRIRFEALDKFLGADWCLGKTFLELGAGDGRITEMLLDRGALHVTLIEGREEICELAKERLQNRQVKVVKRDLDAGICLEGKWDYVLHTGLLYHLSDPRRSIVESIDRCETLILESEVVDLISDSGSLAMNENALNVYDGIGPKGIRMSVNAITKTITDVGMSAVEIPTDDVGVFSYNWKPTDDGMIKYEGKRRRKMWLCKR